MYSGTRLKAPRSASGLHVHSSEQSIGVNSHLCAFTTSESARSTPACDQRSSGQTHAEPAYAASTCSQTPAASHASDAPTVRLPRGGERSDRGNGRRILEVAVPPGRKAEELRHPVERVGLQLGGRRRGAPDERDRVERGGEKLREDARLGGAVGEVGEEPRALPVRRPRQQDLVEVAQNVRKRLASLRRRRGQAVANVARLDLCEHGELSDVFEVPRSPFERGGSVLAKAHRPTFGL